MGRTNLQLEWFFLQVEHLKVNLLIRQLKNLAT